MNGSGADHGGGSAPAPINPHGTLFLLAAALIGLAAAKGWMHFAQPLVDTIQVSSIAVLASIYYGLIYLPLAVLALVLASVCGVRPRVGPLRWTAGALLAGLLGMAFAALLARLNGGVVPGSEPPRGGASLLVIGASLTLFQVAVEELLFRGWLRLTLRALLGPKGAALAAAMAYALFSMIGSGFAVLPLVNLILLALFLGLLAERTGGIAAPIAAHFGWTALEELGLGLNPNPGVGVFGAVRDFDLLGAPLWGGTEAGLAASIGTAAVLAAMILPLLVKSQKPD